MGNPRDTATELRQGAPEITAECYLTL